MHTISSQKIICFSTPMDDHRQTSSDEEQLTHKNRRKSKITTTSGKPRGRPYGSKNKPKPPIIITRESPNTLITHFLEIPPNHDIIQTLTDFTTTRQRALCILTASGTVTNISLRQPPPPHHQPKSDYASSNVLNFTGKFEILSMSGAFMPPPAPPPASGMSVFVCGGQGGMVLGGKVVGKLMTMGVVVIVVTSFANSPYERLPLPVAEDENDNEDEAVNELKIENLISNDRIDQQGRQHLMMMMSTVSPVGATNGGVTGHLLHEMGADELWGGRQQQQPF